MSPFFQPIALTTVPSAISWTRVYVKRYDLDEVVYATFPFPIELELAESREASWYYVQGKILMQMEQYESAHQSFREAVLRSPENNEYRTGALEAALAMKKEKTLPGKARKLWKNLTRKD